MSKMLRAIGDACNTFWSGLFVAIIVAFVIAAVFSGLAYVFGGTTTHRNITISALTEIVIPLPHDRWGAEAEEATDLFPTVYYLSPEGMTRIYCKMREDCDATNVRAMYLPLRRIMYLRSTWSADNLRDWMTFLHEMVHHVQSKTGRFSVYECSPRAERAAYKVVREYLSVEYNMDREDIDEFTNSDRPSEFFHAQCPSVGR